MRQPADPGQRALLVTRNLPPLRGGMERLVARIAAVMAGAYDLSVVGPAGCGRFLPPTVRAVEVPHRPLARFLMAGSRAAWRMAAARPRVVLAGSGLAAPLAWLAARRARSKLVVYLHGLDVVAPSAIYQHCWLPFIRRADLVLVNSRNTRRLASERGVPAANIEVLHPGAAPVAPDAGAALAFRETHGLGDRPMLLSVGRLTPRKGLAEFIRRALPAIVERCPEAVLMVIGADADDAVQVAAGSELSRIRQAVAQAGLDTNVRLLPPCDDTVLSAAYFAADVHVFPVLDLPGDVEGFGMVAIEAAAHGLPTVGFAVGGVPDAIAEGRSGSLVVAGDYPGFAVHVGDWLAKRADPDVAAGCRLVAAEFDWEHFDRRLQEHLRRMDAAGAG